MFNKLNQLPRMNGYLEFEFNQSYVNSSWRFSFVDECFRPNKTTRSHEGVQMTWMKVGGIHRVHTPLTKCLWSLKRQTLIQEIIVVMVLNSIF